MWADSKMTQDDIDKVKSGNPDKFALMARKYAEAKRRNGR